MPASDPPLAIPAARLLPHVLDATAHARHLRAAPGATVRLLSTAAAGLQDSGQLDTARPLLDRALDIAQEDLGPDHPDTLAVRANLARWLGEAGQPGQAAAQYRDLLTDSLRVLGPDHPDTLTTRANLAYWLGAAGQPDQATAQYRDLLDDLLRVLGPDHPHTLTARDQLAYWQSRRESDG
jgi:tetratricopeptide (TPR) repeat protein